VFPERTAHFPAFISARVSRVKRAKRRIPADLVASSRVNDYDPERPTDRPTDRPNHALLTARICCAHSLRASTCIRMPATCMATYEWVSRILAARRNALSRCNNGHAMRCARRQTVASESLVAVPGNRAIAKKRERRRIIRGYRDYVRSR